MSQAKRFDPVERLDRAVDAFWQNGFEASGMQAICQAMGLFPGSLYATYGDKRQLFLKAIERYIAQCSQQALDTLRRDPSGLGAIRAYFDELVEGILTGRRRWGCLLTNAIVELAQKDPEVAAIVGEHLRRLEIALDAAIERAHGAGECEAEAGSGSAAFLVCVVQGLNVLARTAPSRAQLVGLADHAVASLRPRARIDTAHRTEH